MAQDPQLFTSTAKLAEIATEELPAKLAEIATEELPEIADECLLPFDEAFTRWYNAEQQQYWNAEQETATRLQGTKRPAACSISFWS